MKSGVYGTGERGGERLCVVEVRLRLAVCVCDLARLLSGLM